MMMLALVAAAALAPADRLLIVAPKRFEKAVAEYAAARKPLEVETATLEDVLSKSPGVDDPEKLKRYIYDAWRARSIKWALLVGDADTIPVRYMVLDRATKEAFDYAFYPSDLYYADLAKENGSFEDWNATREGFHAQYFGEVRGEKNKSDPINYDAVDYKPEIAVGRWPVSNEKELRTVIDKSIAYATRASSKGDPGNGTGEEAKLKAVAIMAGGWIDARGNMDRMLGSLPTSWATEQLYYTDTAKPYKTPPPDESHVLESFKSGARLILHTGHGADDRWEGSITIRSIAGMKNADRLPVVVSAGCSTARFATLPPYEAYVDITGRPHAGTNAGEVFTSPPPPPSCYATGPYNMTGLGEQLLKAGPNGAVVYIGCNTGSQPCGVRMLEGFSRAVANSATIGECWQSAVNFYFKEERLADLKPSDDWYPPSIFFQGMKFMFFGDPSLPVLTRP